MADTDNKVNPIVAGLTGAAIGAGVAVLTTKVLSDKKFRDRIMETASNVRGTVSRSIEMVGEQAKKIQRGTTGKEQASFAHRIGIGRKTRGRKTSSKRSRR